MIENSSEPSDATIIQQLTQLSNAGCSLIQIRTREPLRLATVLRSLYLQSDGEEELPYREWDTVNGWRTFTRQNFMEHLTPGAPNPDDFMTALEYPLKELRQGERSVFRAKADTVHYFVYLNPHPYLENNPYATELVHQYAAILPSTNVCMIFITPDIAMKAVPTGSVMVADLRTPTAPELEETLTRVIEHAKDNFAQGSALSEEDIRGLSYLGLGLSAAEFETFVSIALVAAHDADEPSITVDRLRSGIAVGKTEVVRQSDILELIPTEDINSVGGMPRLKDWIRKRANCYSDEAVAFGIEPPKGFCAVGVPGTGKSLIAKATASVLGVPAVKLDFGRVFSKFVGDSESRVRSALTMVEQMAPCVLFVDEIDKGLGGSGGGGDSGTSSRVLGSFLTWLQECKAKVFVIVTANRVDGLPPELLRRGRFDGIFSVGLPDVGERREVLAIHLAKRNKDIDELDDVESIIEASHGYVPAEIESAVKDGLIDAFSSGQDLQSSHIVHALQEMIPMSVSHKESIDRIVAWAKANATPVNYPDGTGQKGGTGKSAVVAGSISLPPTRRSLTRPVRRNSKK